MATRTSAETRSPSTLHLSTTLFATDDEGASARMLAYLQTSGAEITVVGGTAGVLRALQPSHAAAVLAPRTGALGTAMEAAQKLRSQQERIVIMIISNEWVQPLRLRALELGCDQCLEADTPPDVILAIGAALAQRRARPSGAGTVTWGPFSVNLIEGVARVGQHVVRLQPLQLRILALFVSRAGRVVTHEELRCTVFGGVAQCKGSTSIARQISALRKHLGEFRELLVTARGGYCLNTDTKARAFTALSE